MDGINAYDGTLLTGIPHLRQSIRDILTTPIGTRVMRREYGSKIPRLIDAPINAKTIMAIYAAATEALKRWEPRFRLTSCKIVTASPGSIELDVIGVYLPDGKIVKLDGIEIK